MNTGAIGGLTPYRYFVIVLLRNLRGVLKRKDLPIIHAICVPRLITGNTGTTSDSDSSRHRSFLDYVLPELEKSRDMIVSEVHKVGVRSVDNMISDLLDSAQHLRMHAKVLERVSTDSDTVVRKITSRTLTVSLGLGALTLAAFAANLTLVSSCVGVLLAASPAVGYACVVYVSKTRFSSLIDGTGLEDAFLEAHKLEVRVSTIEAESVKLTPCRHLHV